MLFNSFEFIFVLLPVSVVLFYLFSLNGYSRVAIAALVLASLFFYAWWNPIYLVLLIFSILVNYSLGILLLSPDKLAFLNRKQVLIIGICLNIGLLAYFKYTGFFINNINHLFGLSIGFGQNIILPLAISFFTFQQIAYLVDTYYHETKEYNFLDYSLFVSFFPQLIAGPIVHHKEMLPQFAEQRANNEIWINLGIGLTIFSIGLFKKVIIADNIALHSTPVFSAANAGTELSFFSAWVGVLAYTFQIYFDFSGYSDMAIGLARLFGIRLPLNFHSPYKSRSIVEFWRKWHMTLSRFLRDYLYIPLGGNKKGNLRRYTNLLITMLLGGLWHGAGWTFIIWGALHGLFLIINHAWHKIKKIFFSAFNGNRFFTALAIALTFFCIVISWVFFRAESLDAALNMLAAMFGMNGISLPVGLYPLLNKLGGLGSTLAGLGVRFEYVAFFNPTVQIPFIMLLFAAVWFMPNTQEIMDRFKPAFDFYGHAPDAPGKKWWHWRPNIIFALISGILFALTILTLYFSGHESEFLYFQF